MDVETEPSNDDLNNSTKIEEIRKSANLEPTEQTADNRKTNIKRKRSSRSKTPQKKAEDIKILHVSLTKVEEEQNGKDLSEEPVETLDKEKNCNDVKINKLVRDAKEKNTNGSVEETSQGEDIKEKENGVVTEETKDLQENGTHEENDTAKDNGLKSEHENEKKQESSKKIEKRDSKISSESEEMDPLVVGDEVETELQFLEENSDKDSGKGSPVIPRCVTRRSYTRNIPTPKTPKLTEDPDSEKNSVVDHTEETICNLPNDVPIPKTDLNESNDSMDTANISTRAELGGDSTHLDFDEEMNTPDFPPFDDAYFDRIRERTLSARRPLRTTDDYRRRVLRNAQNKSKLNLPYDSVEMVSSIGVKRKNRSVTPEGSKKFKIDSPGYTTFFTSPLASLRNKFNKGDLPSSTPELLSYKDDKRNLHFNDSLDIQQIEDAGDDEKKSWCSVM